MYLKGFVVMGKQDSQMRFYSYKSYLIQCLIQVVGSMTTFNVAIKYKIFSHPIFFVVVHETWLEPVYKHPPTHIRTPQPLVSKPKLKRKCDPLRALQ